MTRTTVLGAPSSSTCATVDAPTLTLGLCRENRSWRPQRLSAFGWHHTGDIGFKDEEGYVYIVDRKRDMIISGGFNVFSTEVEARLLAHEAVQDCAVVGVPDEKWGEAVTAIVELKPGMAATADELIAFCRPALGGVKTPKRIEIWPTLPRSPVGKVLKRAIRDRFWAGRARAV